MDSQDATTRSAGQVPMLGVLAVLCFVAAVAVRGMTPTQVTRPEDVIESERRIAEPMQLLSRGAALRAHELDEHIGETHRATFKECRTRLFSLKSCPSLMEWMDGADGQKLERELRELRTSSREEALAAVCLLFQLARATEWKPGLRGESQHAERLGGLMQDWLRMWAATSAKDPLLVEPALAAALVYGHVMRTAWNAPVVGHNEAPYERARAFLGELTGAGTNRRTDFGESLYAHYPRAFLKLAQDKDALSGLADEALIVFPDLGGDCSQ